MRCPSSAVAVALAALLVAMCGPVVALRSLSYGSRGGSLYQSGYNDTYDGNCWRSIYWGVGAGEGFTSDAKAGGGSKSIGMYVYISESSYCYGEEGYGKSAYESYGGDLKAPDARALGLTDMFIPPSAELARLKGSVALPICNGESVCKTARVTFNIDVKCPTSPFGGRSSYMFSYPSAGTTERYRSQGNQCAPEGGQAFPPSALQLTIDGVSLAEIPFGISNSFSYNTYSSTLLTSRK